MKKHVKDFILRGLLAASGGPIILSIVYLLLSHFGVVEEVSVAKISVEVLTVTLMGFIAGGVTVVHQIERLSTFCAALIHGVALYADYILFYLVNGWLKKQMLFILIFSAVFILGYLFIWLIILLTTRSHIKRLNKKLQK